MEDPPAVVELERAVVEDTSNGKELAGTKQPRRPINLASCTTKFLWAQVINVNKIYAISVRCCRYGMTVVLSETK
jgi:hypothetical protein